MRHSKLVAAAAVLGFFGVAFGAFGAHSLGLAGKDVETWHTAGQYHVAHALTALLAAPIGVPRAGWLFIAGAVLFSGSLYLLVVTGQRWLGPVTPLGGLCFLAGWALLAFSALKQRGSNVAEAPSPP